MTQERCTCPVYRVPDAQPGLPGSCPIHAPAPRTRKHSQDKGKDLHQTMVKIQKSHEAEVAILTQELRVSKEALRIITGGDQEMIDAVIDQARERYVT